MVSSLLIGGYFAIEFFPGRPVVQVLVCTSAVVTGFSLVAIRAMDLRVAQHGPSSKSMAVHNPLLLPALLAVGLLLPISYGALFFTSQPTLPQALEVLLPDEYTLQQYNEERIRAAHAILIAVFAAEGLLIALTIKLKESGLTRSRATKGSSVSAENPRVGVLRSQDRGPYQRQATGFLGAGSTAARASGFLGGVPVAGRDTPVEAGRASSLGWLLGAGNVAAIACYILSCRVADVVMGYNPLTFVVLAPVLLLANQEKETWSPWAPFVPWICQIGLPPQRRYALPVAAISIGLLLRSGWEIANPPEDFDIYGPSSLRESVVRMLRDGTSVAMVAPLHFEFLSFLWEPLNPTRARGLLQVGLWMPVSLVGALLTTTKSIRVGALVSLLLGTIEMIVVWRRRSKGRRIL